MSVPWYLMAKGKGGGGYKTASGPIVSVSDALAAPLRSLLVNIEPVQEGTGDPSPVNVRPISGWSAVNVWRTGENLLDDADFRDYSKWSATIAPSGTMPSTEANRIYSLPPLVAGEEYTISFGISELSFPTYLYFGYYANGEATKLTYISVEAVRNRTYTFTAMDGVTYALRMGGTNTQSKFNTQIGKIGYEQLELGSTATPYEPYSGNQYTIQLGQTVYGATLDVTNGVLMVEYAILSKKWSEGTDSGTATDIQRKAFYPPVNADISIRNKFKCNYAKVVGSYGVIGLLIVADNQFYLTLPTDTDGDTNIQILYPLATPITIPLTPTEISTLQGQNNVWADTGDVRIEYRVAGGVDPDLMKLAVAFMGRD